MATFTLHTIVVCRSLSSGIFKLHMVLYGMLYLVSVVQDSHFFITLHQSQNTCKFYISSQIYESVELFRVSFCSMLVVVFVCVQFACVR
jgi:hypothetical protein